MPDKSCASACFLDNLSTLAASAVDVRRNIPIGIMPRILLDTDIIVFFQSPPTVILSAASKNPASITSTTEIPFIRESSTEKILLLGLLTLFATLDTPSIYLSLPTLIAIQHASPSWTLLPARISAPASLCTGRDSPLIMDSSTSIYPLRTTASTGTCAPA